MRSGLWVFLVALSLAAGCATRTVTTQSSSDQEQWLAQVPVAGDWSASVNGLRSRVQVSQRQAMETSTILGTIVIENVGKTSLPLSQSGPAPLEASAIAWRLRDTAT